MAAASAFAVANKYWLSHAVLSTTPVFLTEQRVAAVAFAASIFEDDVLPMVQQAVTHCPESHEAMRIVNVYAQAYDLANVCDDILEEASGLRDISRMLQGMNSLARLSKSHHEQWKAVRSNIAGHAVRAEIDGYVVYRTADVMELLGYGAEAARLRALAHVTGVAKPAYCFHDPEYLDTVVVHDSDSEVD